MQHFEYTINNIQTNHTFFFAQIRVVCGNSGTMMQAYLYFCAE